MQSGLKSPDRLLAWSGGGKPTYHPAFRQALEMVSATGLPQGLFTHGVFAEELCDPIARHCEWVRVSIDTHDPRKYAERRNASPAQFERVSANVRELVRLGKARVGLNMNVSEWNKHDIPSLVAHAADLGVAYLQVRPTLPTPIPFAAGDDYLTTESIELVRSQLQAIQANRSGKAPEFIVSWDKFDDLQKGNGGRDDENWDYRGCAAHKLFVVLNSNGDLVVCMYHLHDDRFRLGNIYGKGSLAEIWESCASVRRFCNDLDHTGKRCQVCCKGHEINKILLSPSGVSMGRASDRIEGAFL